MINNVRKNKRGQAVAIWILVAVVIGAIIIGGVTWFNSRPSVDQATAAVAAASGIAKTGDVASLKVFVRDMAADDVNTKIVVPVYCQESDGEFTLDGTSSSATAQITGQTTIGETVTCWAFNSTIQTVQPTVINVDKEVKQVVIDAYTVSTTATIDFFDDTFTVADNGISNITIASPGSDTYQKAKFTNTGSKKWYPLGGFFVDTVEGSNVSSVSITGSATVGGISGKSSTQIVASTLSTRVSARRSKFDFVFELDDGNAISGNDGFQPIILEQNDFIETSIVVVESTTAEGCEGNETVSWNSFTKGYYREATNTGVAYGHESDAVSSVVITADVSLDGFVCAQIT